MAFGIFSIERFYGIDVILDTLIIIISGLISVQSKKIYSIIKDKDYKRFSMAFALIGFAFLFKIIIGLTILHTIEITEINLFSQIGNIIENLQIINFYSILFFKIFLMVGVIALFLITNKNKKSQNLFLLIYFGTISVILSIYANFIFYFTISIILSLLVIYFYKNFKENPSQHRKLTFLAFLFILIGNTIEIFNVYSNIFYISYEILLFVGFSILFTNHLRIRNGKKKNKN
ncbi:hypothetical protein GW932_03050 [archaeon]|nr:hypothetical protein [archaeon]